MKKEILFFCFLFFVSNVFSNNVNEVSDSNVKVYKLDKELEEIVQKIVSEKEMYKKLYIENNNKNNKDSGVSLLSVLGVASLIAIENLILWDIASEQNKLKRGFNKAKRAVSKTFNDFSKDLDRLTQPRRTYYRY
jgi:hypothetical protein